jgi:hypothetical protein
MLQLVKMGAPFMTKTFCFHFKTFFNLNATTLCEFANLAMSTLNVLKNGVMGVFPTSSIHNISSILAQSQLKKQEA